MKRLMLLLIVAMFSVSVGLATTPSAEVNPVIVEKQEMPVGVENEYAALVRHAKKTLEIKKEIDLLKLSADKNAKKALAGIVWYYNDRVRKYNFFSDGFENYWPLFEKRADMPQKKFRLLKLNGDYLTE